MMSRIGNGWALCVTALLLASPVVGCASDAQGTTPPEGTVSPDATTSRDGASSSAGPSGETGDEPDTQLQEWPQSYQDFIAASGGSQFVEVNGVRMHYVDVGPRDGEVVLLLHGIPTHSFLWREVLPELTGKRAIALDFVGFGRSERPATLDYTPAMQVEFLAGFADTLGLEDVHLVVQDMGGIVGLRWAAENPENVASLTMFETLWSTVPSLESLAPPFGGEGGLLDQMRDPKTGPTLVGEQNLFLASLPDFTLGGVSDADLAAYTHPWPDADERGRILRSSGPLAFPLPESPDAQAFVRVFQDYLESDDVPKLVIAIEPGALTGALVPIDGSNGELVPQPDYAAASFPNVTVATLKGSVHFAQEDLGPELGALIAGFVDDVK